MKEIMYASYRDFNPPLRHMEEEFQAGERLQKVAEQRAQEYVAARKSQYYPTNVRIDFQNRRVTLMATPNISGIGQPLSFDTEYLTTDKVNGLTLRELAKKEREEEEQTRNGLIALRDELENTPEVKKYIEINRKLGTWMWPVGYNSIGTVPLTIVPQGT